MAAAFETPNVLIASCTERIFANAYRGIRSAGCKLISLPFWVEAVIVHGLFEVEHMLARVQQEMTEFMSNGHPGSTVAAAKPHVGAGREGDDGVFPIRHALGAPEFVVVGHPEIRVLDKIIEREFENRLHGDSGSGGDAQMRTNRVRERLNLASRTRPHRM